MIPAIEGRGLAKRYGAIEAFCDVSLTVAPGEFVALLGPSGAGKTTLFRCLARLIEPDAGEILLGGRAYHTLRGRMLATARRDIGVVFQQFNLIRRLTAIQNVLTGRLGSTPLWRVALRRFGSQDRTRAFAALEAVGLAAQSHQRADTLSGGQQQRVAIARAIAQQSRVLLADEPVASLDPETAISVLSLLRSLARERGLAVLCTLHQPRLAASFADRIIAMNAGHLESQVIAEDDDSPSERARIAI